MTRERRKMRRYPVQAGHNWAVLTSGAEERSVVLVDQSANGFCIAAEPGLKVQSGQTLQLRVRTGVYSVEVANIERVKGETRIGLRIVGERVEAVPEVENAGRVRRYWQFEATGPLARVFAATVVGALICGVFFAVMLSHDVIGGRATQTHLTARGGRSLGLDSHSAGMEVVNSLTSAEMSRALRLNEDQQQLRDRIFAEASQALSQLYEGNSDQSSEARTEESSKVVEQALERYLRMLNRRQVEQLLTKLPHSASKPPGTP